MKCIPALILIFILSCGGDSDKKKQSTSTATPKIQDVKKAVPASEKDLTPAPSLAIESLPDEDHSIRQILNSITGFYTGRGDVDYSWYSFLKPSAHLKINIVYSNEREELLIHVSEKDGEEFFCTAFGSIKKYIDAVKSYSYDQLQMKNPQFHFYLPSAIEPVALIGSMHFKGAIQDARMVTHVHKSEDAFLLYIGKNALGRELVKLSLSKKKVPEKTFETFREECLPSRNP